MPLDAMFTFEAVDLVMMAGHELAKKAKIRITRESPYETYECTLNALKTLKKQVGFCHFWLRWSMDIHGHPWTMDFDAEKLQGESLVRIALELEKLRAALECEIKTQAGSNFTENCV